MAGVAGYGMKLRRGGTAGTAVANVTNIRGPGWSVDALDVSAHDSANATREFVPGLIDPGEITVDFRFEADEATHDETAGGLLSDLKARTVTTWAIEWPTTPASFAYGSAFITNFEPDGPHDDVVGGSLTLKCTGAWTLA